MQIASGLWVNTGVPDMIQMAEIKDFGMTYGKFWCTWQVDRGDRLPLGAPALMTSPQGVNMSMINPELIEKRDAKYEISSEELRKNRVDIPVPEEAKLYADYWMRTGKGFAVDVEQTEMKSTAPFP